MSRLYQISGTIAAEVLERVVFNTWKTYPNGNRYARARVAGQQYWVVVTEDDKGLPTQIVITGPSKKTRTMEPTDRAAFMAKRLSHLKAKWEAIEPAEGTIPWYSKRICEKAAAGRRGTVRFYENCLAEFQGRMATDFTLEELREEYSELHECQGHESLEGPIGNVTYCDGTCR